MFEKPILFLLLLEQTCNIRNSGGISLSRLSSLSTPCWTKYEKSLWFSPSSVESLFEGFCNITFSSHPRSHVWKGIFFLLLLKHTCNIRNWGWIFVSCPPSLSTSSWTKHEKSRYAVTIARDVLRVSRPRHILRREGELADGCWLDEPNNDMDPPRPPPRILARRRQPRYPPLALLGLWSASQSLHFGI